MSPSRLCDCSETMQQLGCAPPEPATPGRSKGLRPIGKRTLQLILERVDMLRRNFGRVSRQVDDVQAIYLLGRKSMGRSTSNQFRHGFAESQRASFSILFD